MAKNYHKYGRGNYRKKRSKAEYDREADDAVRRFKKYPEFFRNAYDVNDWQEFLMSIGIHEPNAKSDFFETVREKTLIQHDKELQRQREIDLRMRDRITEKYKGSGQTRTGRNAVYYEVRKQDTIIIKEVYPKHTAYRNPVTGRFTKELK
jgi:hypothetical protein